MSLGHIIFWTSENRKKIIITPIVIGPVNGVYCTSKLSRTDFLKFFFFFIIVFSIVRAGKRLDFREKNSKRKFRPKNVRQNRRSKHQSTDCRVFFIFYYYLIVYRGFLANKIRTILILGIH